MTARKRKRPSVADLKKMENGFTRQLDQIQRVHRQEVASRVVEIAQLRERSEVYGAEVERLSSQNSELRLFVREQGSDIATLTAQLRVDVRARREAMREATSPMVANTFAGSPVKK